MLMIAMGEVVASAWGRYDLFFRSDRQRIHIHQPADQPLVLGQRPGGVQQRLPCRRKMLQRSAVPRR